MVHLVGEKVICLTAVGKFSHFMWAPAYGNLEVARNTLTTGKELTAYPDALAECRSLNMEFYQRVMSIIS